MLNQNTAHAKHPTTTLLRALKSSDCKKHGCQLLPEAQFRLGSGWIQHASRAGFNLIIRESARRRRKLFFAKRLWPEKVQLS